MKQIVQNNCQTWYNVAEFVVHGKKCIVRKCEWKDNGLHNLDDFFTGYVQCNSKMDTEDLEVHGGITFDGELPEAKGYWIGFDTAHIFDDKNTQNEKYVTEELKKLALQIVNKEKELGL